MPNRVTIVENRKAKSICESQSRYDIFLDGKLHFQAYYSMRGYNAEIPFPDGSLSLSEVSFNNITREIRKANKEWNATACKA